MKFYQQRSWRVSFRLTIINQISYKERNNWKVYRFTENYTIFNGSQLHPVLQFKSWKSCYFLPQLLCCRHWDGNKWQIETYQLLLLLELRDKREIGAEMVPAISSLAASLSLLDRQCLLRWPVTSDIESALSYNDTVDALSIYQLDFVFVWSMIYNSILTFIILPTKFCFLFVKLLWLG